MEKIVNLEWKNEKTSKLFISFINQKNVETWASCKKNGAMKSLNPIHEGQKKEYEDNSECL